MSIGKRLLEQRKKTGFSSQETLGNALDVSLTTIARWEKDQSPIPSDKLLAMGELGLDVIYILTGKSPTSAVLEDLEPRKNSDVDSLQIKKPPTVGGFPHTTSSSRLAIAEGMEIYSVREDELAPRGVSKPPEIEGYVFVPILDVEASSGDGRFLLSENITEYVPFSLNELRKNNLNPKYLIGGHNRGDSMSPTLPERGLFVYDESKTRVDGGIFFFLYHDEFYLKRLTREGDSLRVISDNPAYPAWVIEDVENCHVIGKKVWHERWGG